MNAMKHANMNPGKISDVATPLGKLHVVEIGIGTEVIVLWPSIFTNHHIYDELVQLLYADFRFVLIDGPGHGKSDGPTVPFMMGECADSILAVMDHLGHKEAIVGGTSWGGLVAADLAIRHPDRAQAVLMLNTPMELDHRSPSFKARMISFGARWMLRTAAFRNGVAGSFFHDPSFARNQMFKTAFEKMFAETDPRKLGAAVRSVLLHTTPLRPRLKHIKHPTLIVAGKQDDMYPIEQQAEAALHVADCQFEPVEGKHISVVDNPEAVAKIMRSFVGAEVRA